MAGRTEHPGTYEEVARLLREASGAGLRVCARGGGTKLGWGNPVPEPDLEISTTRLNRIHEHNRGDLTAVLDAGVRLADAQATFAEAGQMLAIDPPLGEDGGATLGGVLATGDSGPLAHGYGRPRDLVLGMTVALGDGTIARSGGKVIKNVAGYDLPKLFSGSFGTLGVILQAVVRLHPQSLRRASLRVPCDEPGSASTAALTLAHAPLELESLGVSWAEGRGEVVAVFAGAASAARAGRARDLLGAGDVDDRTATVAFPRREDGVGLRVGSLPGRLDVVLAAADRIGASVHGAVSGSLEVALPSETPDELADRIETLRAELAPSPVVVRGAPREVREHVDVWGPLDPALVRLMRRVKERFDPFGVMAPGLYAGGI